MRILKRTKYLEKSQVKSIEEEGLKYISQYNSSGKDKYIDKLFALYYQLIIGSFVSISQNDQGLIDCLPEALTNLYCKTKETSKLPQQENILSWFIICLSRNIINQHKSRLNKTTEERIIVSLKESEVEFMEKQSFYCDTNTSTDEDEISANIQANDDEELLLKCIDELKDGQRECMKAYWIHNKSYAEIATDLQLSIKKVKSNLQNGKRNLKIKMEEKI